jgi:hypothetical protein
MLSRIHELLQINKKYSDNAIAKERENIKSLHKKQYLMSSGHKKILQLILK